MAEKQQIVCQGSDKLYAKVKILPYFQVHKPWNYYNLNCDNALFQFFLPKRNKVWPKSLNWLGIWFLFLNQIRSHWILLARYSTDVCSSYFFLHLDDSFRYFFQHWHTHTHSPVLSFPFDTLLQLFFCFVLSSESFKRANVCSSPLSTAIPCWTHQFSSDHWS